MVRPVGAFLLMFALLSLIVHQIGMFEFLGAVGTALLVLDVMVARFSTSTRPAGGFREPNL
jgi:hypothetical protein